VQSVGFLELRKSEFDELVLGRRYDFSNDVFNGMSAFDTYTTYDDERGHREISCQDNLLSNQFKNGQTRL